MNRGLDECRLNGLEARKDWYTVKWVEIKEAEIEMGFLESRSEGPQLSLAHERWINSYVFLPFRVNESPECKDKYANVIGIMKNEWERVKEGFFSLIFRSCLFLSSRVERRKWLDNGQLSITPCIFSTTNYMRLCKRLTSLTPTTSTTFQAQISSLNEHVHHFN